jgi:hypothetical protein
MANGNNTSSGAGSTGGGETADGSVIKPEQWVIIAAAAAVGGLVGGLVGSILGSGKG